MATGTHGYGFGFAFVTGLRSRSIRDFLHKSSLARRLAERPRCSKRHRDGQSCVTYVLAIRGEKKREREKERDRSVCVLKKVNRFHHYLSLFLSAITRSNRATRVNQALNIFFFYCTLFPLPLVDFFLNFSLCCFRVVSFMIRLRQRDLNCEMGKYVRVSSSGRETNPFEKVNASRNFFVRILPNWDCKGELRHFVR